MRTKIDNAALERAWGLYRKGYSTSQLSNLFGVSKGYFKNRFRLLYGADYTKKVNKRGLRSVVEEYVTKTQGKDRDTIKLWLDNNIEMLVDIDSSSDTNLLNDKQLDALTRKECCHANYDFRQLIDEIHDFS